MFGHFSLENSGCVVLFVETIELQVSKIPWKRIKTNFSCCSTQDSELAKHEPVNFQQNNSLKTENENLLTQVSLLTTKSETLTDEIDVLKQNFECVTQARDKIFAAQNGSTRDSTLFSAWLDCVQVCLFQERNRLETEADNLRFSLLDAKASSADWSAEKGRIQQEKMELHQKVNRLMCDLDLLNRVSFGQQFRGPR